ncbi:MAG TPA: hypothetical protein VMP10_01450 [Chloroflexota bacterium]|nr:hypothetical protein [Chloroflexota bacterium]
MRSFHRRILPSCLALAIVLLLALPTAGFAQDPDYAIPNGRFFTQTAPGDNGFSVVDAGTDGQGQTIRMWSEFQRLGGVTTLGYPASRRFVGTDGFIYQVFQRGVLQWRPEANRAVLTNIFEWFNPEQDAWLQSLGIPGPIHDDGSGGNFEQAVQIRLGWLTQPAIRNHFLSSPNLAQIPTWNQDRAMELYGLPMSQPERSGPFIVQRFQRIAFQLWVDQVPGMPPPGSVVGILGGDLLKEAGLIPAAAVAPEGPGGTGGVIVQPTPTPTPPPPPPPPAATAFRTGTFNQFPNCGTTYVRGVVRDSAGNSIDGISVRTWNDFGNEVISGSGADRGGGYWDRIIGGGARGGRWYAAVVDGEGRISSPVVTLNFTDNCEPGGVQEIELDFIRN